MSRFSLIGILVVSFCLMINGCGPSRVTLNPESDINLIRKVAVATVEKTPEFEVAAGQWEGDLISLGFIVVDRGNIDSIIKEQGLSLSGATRSDDVMKIGKLLGVDAILFVDKGIQDWFSEKYGQVHLVNVNSGRVVFTANPTAVYDLYKPLSKVLKKKKWEYFYKKPFYTWGSYLIGKPYVVNKNNITLDRFKASWIPGFDQRTIKKVALSPKTQHDLMAPLLSAGYDVIERRQLEKIMKELGLSASGMLNQKDMKKIGKLYGIDGMIFSGKVKQELKGQGCCIHHFIKLIHLETGSVVWTMRIFDFKEEVTPEEIGKFIKKLLKRSEKLAQTHHKGKWAPESLVVTEDEPVPAAPPAIEKKESVPAGMTGMEEKEAAPEVIEKEEPAKEEVVKEEPEEPAKKEAVKEEPAEKKEEETK
ncbi:MAG: hypothetical protein JW983_02345 [Elusimicrobia bacterium]|nr:hypothetical protein [Elusimicrobiota bacterium]